MKTAKEILEKYLLISWMRCKPATVKRIIEAMEEYAQQKQQLNLPSDEEIENMAKNYPHNYYRNSHDFVLGLTLGAKFMREEIKKSNKNV